MRIFSILLCLIAVPSLAGPGYDSAEFLQRARTINRPVGASLRSVLQPSDDIVIVSDGVSSPPLTIAFSSDEERERYEWDLLSRRGNTLLLVRAESVTSALDADETWIKSSTRFHILDVLSAGGQLPDGKWGDMTIDTKDRSITLNFDGGEVRIGKTLISAGDYSVFEQGNRYLISFRVVPEEQATHLGLVYRVAADGVLSPPQRSRGSSTSNPSGLKGKRLEDVRKSVGRPAK